MGRNWNSTRSDDEATVGVTAEQAWQAYEAFTADQQPDQQPEAEAEDTSDSAAVLEIDVPELAITASADGGKPQQLVLRIELAIVDSNGRRVDPANVAVRVSHVESAETPPAPVPSAAEPAEPQPAFVPEPQAAVETEGSAFDEPPWPTEPSAARYGSRSRRSTEPHATRQPWPPAPVNPAEPMTAFATAAPAAAARVPAWAPSRPVSGPCRRGPNSRRRRIRSAR